MRILVLLSLFSLAFAKDEDRFFKYPKNLIPVRSTPDYNLVNASTIIVEKTKEEVFKNFKFSTTLYGFIFHEESGNVTKVLSRARGGSNFTGDIGELERVNGYSFYEQVPVLLDNGLFMYKFFEMEDLGKNVPKDYKCLAATSSVIKCEDIPRCMGEIEGECLVSSVSRNKPLISSNKKYKQKRREHKHIRGIRNNFVLFWALYGSSVAVLILVPRMLDFVTFKFLYKKASIKSQARVTHDIY
jgi:hypothetical protein